MKSPDTFSVKPREILMNADQTIYQQGDVSDGVYVILEGRVRISHDDHGENHEIATLEEGTLLGEVGAIEETPRSVTAITLSKCKLFFIDAESFRRVFKDGDPFIRYLVETLANRLRATYTETQDDKKTPKDKDYYTSELTHRKSLVIGADSPVVKSVLPVPVEIRSMPFSVGNHRVAGAKPSITRTALKLPLLKHHELSNPHFEIVSRDNALWIRDLGSKHGTLVNDHTVSRYAEEAVARLHPGLNRIVVGSRDSSIRFLVQVPWQEDATT